MLSGTPVPAPAARDPADTGEQLMEVLGRRESGACASSSKDSNSRAAGHGPGRSHTQVSHSSRPCASQTLGNGSQIAATFAVKQLLLSH